MISPITHQISELKQVDQFPSAMWHNFILRGPDVWYSRDLGLVWCSVCKGSELRGVDVVSSTISCWGFSPGPRYTLEYDVFAYRADQELYMINGILLHFVCSTLYSKLVYS